MCHAPIEEQMGICPPARKRKGGGARLGRRAPKDNDAWSPIQMGLQVASWYQTRWRQRLYFDQSWRHLRMLERGSGDVIPPIRFRSDCTKRRD
ncbi:hypothetical protein COCNU_10G005350 [Cocos nucifera]|uniref:Uncharacterized protein n=1 Tax=Cocos nucifera TaxID=13894 RepID=A0A8K0ILB6_COCNU|nr:hypothetical protein COCNU_10G005350 [Cocos nucifera]